jgi:phosphotriesterase-related protein
MHDDTGQIVTVQGRIDPEELGVTLPHEHLFADWSEKFDPPDDPAHEAIANGPISLSTLWYTRRNPSGHRANLVLDSADTAVSEVERFADAGGETLVDVTPKGVGGDPERVRAVAEQTGVNVVHGTAYYYADEHPEHVADTSIEEVADEFVSDVREGIGDTDVRAGIVGEIGTSTDESRDGIHEREEKVLRAAARAARRTGAALSVHPPAQRDPGKPPSSHGLDIVDIAEQEGLPPERVVICHMDQSKFVDGGMEAQKAIAERGAFVEFDLFDHDRYMHGQGDAQPADTDRVEFVRELVAAGHADRLLLSHDVFTKHKLTAYGGNGYAHILEEVVPMLEDRGVPDGTVDQLLVENPREVLTFAEPDR